MRSDPLDVPGRATDRTRALHTMRENLGWIAALSMFGSSFSLSVSQSQQMPVEVPVCKTAFVRMFRRASRVAMIALVVLWVGVAPAFARDGDGSDKAGDLVRQAIAHLVHEPNNPMAAAEKIDAAINAADKSGVDIGLVVQAATAVRQGDSHGARTLLERSIGARPHIGGTDPQPIGEVPSFAVGAETGIDVVTDPLAPYRTLSGGDVAALSTIVALGALGSYLAVRFRPRQDSAL